MTDLRDLGWSDFFQRQLSDTEADLSPMRVAQVHRDALVAQHATGEARLTLPGGTSTGDVAVGDWVLADADGRVQKTLDRQTELGRRAAGTDARRQLIAANVDTLFIVTSCNADFSPARLERYLVLAQEAGCFPVVVLTKADLAEDPRDYEARAFALAPMLTVLCLDATAESGAAPLLDWCGAGQTAALVGSSGVGKSTLAAALTGTPLATAGIREDDAHGRHTTTSRGLWRMVNGGWLIDTPGMRALRLHEAREGIGALFSDIEALADACRFRDCAHESEPGCAVMAAIDEGTLEPDRLSRYRKLLREEARNSESVAEARARDKSFGKVIREVTAAHRGRKGRRDR